MNSKYRLGVLLVVDSLIVICSIYISHFFINPSLLPNQIVVVSSISLLISHYIFSYFTKFYGRAWRYASIEELTNIVKVVSCSILIVMAEQLIIYGTVYERALFITWMLHIILIGGVRFSWRIYRDNKNKHSTKKKAGKKTLIIGAGSAGRMLARQLKESNNTNLVPVAFVDDDLNLKNLLISGLPVEGPIDKLKEISNKRNVEHIIIAIPSLTQKRLNEVITQAKLVCKDVQILPMIEDLVLGKVKITNIKDVSIEDLLGRNPVELDINSIDEKVRGKTILVTGAGGSIGSELCRQISRFKPKNLVLLGHGEFSIYTIEKELLSSFTDINFKTEIVDVQDRNKMFQIVENYKPSFIFHAAAHKHVPLMERNPEEAVKNNVLGTKNVAEAADAAGVDTFVMISTDKAVNPTSVMGATKRIAEMFIQDIDQRSETRFVAVRFGNVLGSRGSVIPLFKEQIKKGGPVTVTHPEMVRYFMTIPEASRLVIQAGALARGGEIFVLDMGAPVKIFDLARNLIKLSGYSLDDIKIEFTGMRPGEKLYEELLGDNEIHKKQVYPKIYIGKSAFFTNDSINNFLNEFMNQRFEEETLKKVLLDISNNKNSFNHLSVVNK
ncbi:nucleoside-diphosphate sugar epimerase/dehydratase [Alkalihalobacillus sp. AL-G]|uniref:polysaccharide biosynthesis protein n=1 Tax=Alkalihalobacillus sp. AL-G TaxID=2926399 RepID=UPI00272CCCE8|nr:nucleoside-diphosphate sugar epimerase/dehydratase [Alkalihalobacillus sp. AL-G]WLD93019.1 polysaccharide biosynthesis protein [Alkalihalobacillus sp. AL-G]